ncbi:MAG: hypothetical protein IT479_10970 [Xanthomonadales bacterium]|nr:hypothetical protein [Xanthomonadales bacterium]MCC6593784.1 hypothetical protein [Xanthomonadales bacterium]MCE7930079.1 hypothetical protein [Xanthomonadales bacterium PRO6]
MNRAILFVAAASLMAVASTASAGNDLIVASAKSGATAFSADAVLDGEAVGLQFRIKVVGGSDKTRFMLDNCLKSLPKTHQGTCGVSSDKSIVTGLVYSLSNAKLPAGVFPLGTVHVTSGEKVSFEVVEFLVAGDAGRPLEAAVQNALK